MTLRTLIDHMLDADLTAALGRLSHAAILMAWGVIGTLAVIALTIVSWTVRSNRRLRRQRPLPPPNREEGER